MQCIEGKKIVYYSTCPGCGASRVEGKDTCEYCGHTMIKEKEVLTEETVTEEDRPAMEYKKNGTFHYGDAPDTYVRVHVTPPPKSSGGGGGGRGHRSGASSGSSHRSSCACACACAGGGRAGCTTKDFYNTGLKLSQLEIKKKKH